MRRAPELKIPEPLGHLGHDAGAVEGRKAVRGAPGEEAQPPVLVQLDVEEARLPRRGAVRAAIDPDVGRVECEALGPAGEGPGDAEVGREALGGRVAGEGGPLRLLDDPAAPVLLADGLEQQAGAPRHGLGDHEEVGVVAQAGRGGVPGHLGGKGRLRPAAATSRRGCSLRHPRRKTTVARR